MKKRIIIAAILSGFLIFSGCGQSSNTTNPSPDSAPNTTFPNTPSSALDGTDATHDPTPVSNRDAIPFEAGQLYAAAYLGYQTTDGLDYYAERYLDSGKLPIHYVSDGDYYLVIPRYDGMSLSLYVNDTETSISTLRFRDPDCEPFIIQCNASDIFADVTVRLEYNGDTAEFSPFISLKDGTPMFGELGLDLTEPGAAAGGAETGP